MANENENEKKIPNPEESGNDSETIKKLTGALKEVRENSIPKSKYEEAQRTIEELTKAVIDGSGSNIQSNEEPKEIPLKELAKDLLEDGIGNLEYSERALKYRDAYIKKFDKDPFAPNHAEMTEYDSARAEAVAEVMRECIDEANGSESVFTALFTERIKEDSPQMIMALKKRGLIK